MADARRRAGRLPLVVRRARRRAGGAGRGASLGELPHRQRAAVAARDDPPVRPGVAAREARRPDGTSLGALERAPPEPRSGRSGRGASYAEAWAFDQRHAVERAELGGRRWSPCRRWRSASSAPTSPSAIARHPPRSAHARRSGLLFAGVVGPLEPGRHRVERRRSTLADGALVRRRAGEVRSSRGDPVRPARRRTGRRRARDRHGDVSTRRPSCSRRQIESIRAQDHDSWVLHRLRRRLVAGPARRDARRARRRRPLRPRRERPTGRLLPELRAGAGAGPAERPLRRPRRPGRRVAPGQAAPPGRRARRPTRTCSSWPATSGSPTRTARCSRPRSTPTGSPTHDDPYSLFVVNSLIGASMVFRRQLLDLALPFPRAFEDRFHDHWLARVGARRRHRRVRRRAAPRLRPARRQRRSAAATPRGGRLRPGCHARVAATVARLGSRSRATGARTSWSYPARVLGRRRSSLRGPRARQRGSRSRGWTRDRRRSTTGRCRELVPASASTTRASSERSDARAARTSSSLSFTGRSWAHGPRDRDAVARR